MQWQNYIKLSYILVNKRVLLHEVAYRVHLINFLADLIEWHWGTLMQQFYFYFFLQFISTRNITCVNITNNTLGLREKICTTKTGLKASHLIQSMQHFKITR